MQRTAEEVQAAKAAQTAILAAMKAKQDTFSENVSVNFGYELEAHIRTFSDDPQFAGILDEYYGASVLRMNILEVVMAPIIQLAETKGLGAAVIFAERIIVLNQDKNYLTLFKHQISKLAPDVDIQRGYNAANLQISLASLMNIFTFDYALYNLHAVKNVDKFLNPEKEKKAHEDMADLAVAYVFKILRYLEEVAKNKKLNLEELKREFLAEEERAPVAERWRQAMQNRRKIEKDADLARNYIGETLQVIEQNIQQTLLVKPCNEVELERVLNQGFRLITNPDYVALFITELNQIFRRLPRFLENNWQVPQDLTPRMQKQLERYIQIRKIDYKLTYRLQGMGCNITLDQVMALNTSSKKYLYEEISYSTKITFESSITAFTPDMLNHIQKIWKLTKLFPQVDIRKLRNWPKDKLEECLDHLLENAFLLKRASSFNEFDINNLLTWPQPSLDKRIEFLIYGTVQGKAVNIDADFLQRVLRTKISIDVMRFILDSNIANRIVNVIGMLPENLGDQYVHGRMTMAGMRAVHILASRFDSINSKLINCILTNPYFVECFRKKVSCNKEITSILDRKMSVEQIQAIYNEKGVACATKGYCDFAQQCDLPVAVIPFVQTILLDLKTRPEPKFLAALANPNVMAAYHANFIDIFFLENTSVQGLNAVARHWQAARAVHISCVWEPKFASFMKGKESLLKHCNMWANSGSRDKSSKPAHQSNLRRRAP